MRLLPKCRQHITMGDCVDLNKVMPKLKTRKAAAKRFRVSGSGKLMRRKTFRNHLLEHKSKSRIRRLTGAALVDERDAENVHRMLPYI